MDIHFPKELFIPHFRYLLDVVYRYILLWGGRDSGKSHFAAQKLIVECLRLPYFRCVMIKKTHESIKDSQWQTVKDIVFEWGLQEHFIFTKSPLEINCKNGNKFIARGCDKADKLKSIKDPSHAWYEEANQITEEDFITVTSTIRGNGQLQEILSFNPEHPGELEDFWIYQYFFKGKDQKTFEEKISIEIDKETINLPYIVDHSVYPDNPYVTPERKLILENLKFTNPYYYSVFTEGNWGVKEVESPYITTFEDDKHVSTRAIHDPKKQITMSFDFNIDNTTAVFAHVGIDYIHFFDELVGHDLPELLQMVKFKYGKWMAGCMVTGDRSGQNRTHMISDNMNSYRMMKNTLKLSTNQFKIVVNPPHKENRLTCNTLLAFHPDIIFHPRCKGSIFDLKYVECDQEQRIIKKDRNISNQKADSLDCVRYIFNTFKKKWVRTYIPK